jgi:hypothetical protein
MTETERVMKSIESYRGLEKNWDSYFGDAISDEVIELAKRVAAMLPAPTTGRWSVVPTADGGIQFESDVEQIECRFYPVT